MEVQAQRIEGLVANSKNVCEVENAARGNFSAQLSTLRAEGAQAVSLLQAQMESYESNLDALRAELDNRIGSAQSTLISNFENQVKQDMPNVLDQCFSHEVLDRMEEHICLELLVYFDEALAAEAEARQQLERRTMCNFDKLRPLQDEEDVVEQVIVEDAAKQEIDRLLLASEMPYASSASSARGASTRGARVPNGYRAIDETTAVPADVFESLAMAGKVARSRGQHCRSDRGGKQRLVAADFCLDEGSQFVAKFCLDDGSKFVQKSVPNL